MAEELQALVDAGKVRNRADLARRFGLNVRERLVSLDGLKIAPSVPRSS